MRRFLAAAAATAALAAVTAASVPAQADSRVTVRVELYYGAAAAGGMGLFVYLAGSWEALGEGLAPATALVEIEGGRARFGLPLPLPWAGPGDDAPAAGMSLDLVRVRF